MQASLEGCAVAVACALVRQQTRVEIMSAVVMYADGAGGLVLDEGEKRKTEL